MDGNEGAVQRHGDKLQVTAVVATSFGEEQEITVLPVQMVYS